MYAWAKDIYLFTALPLASNGTSYLFQRSSRKVILLLQTTDIWLFDAVILGYLLQTYSTYYVKEREVQIVYFRNRVDENIRSN